MRSVMTDGLLSLAGYAVTTTAPEPEALTRQWLQKGSWPHF
ncbi:hypothetical protein Hsw_3209 [Hymenobacter swuensis DY53]|uniref:Uncharacterized protein n=1 Tax=Hymenobacter swuensis DY53 TaxID=1227739 RepID=W8F087_9BACT|nr:hypothetical protein Hsw_3209 [Hymenobacter swuensis DY53]